MVNNTGRIVSPDGYAGGILGINYTGDGAITNCYNTGEVFGDTAGGILAIYIGGIIKNCYNTGDLNYSYYIMGGIIGSDLDGSAFDNTTNCYYLDTSCTNDSTTPEECDVKIKTVDQFESGEVAYLLQSEQEEAIWGQKIGTDKYPVFGGDSVYAIFESCISNPKYTNNASEVTEIPHKYENGFCTICSKFQKPIFNNNNTADNNTDDYYEIANAGNLYWFAEQVNEGNVAINAKLTKNIVVNDGEISEDSVNVKEWIPINSSMTEPYTGIFDGNNKTISGLYFNNSEQKYVGLFGISYGVIKNLGIINSYINGFKNVGSVVGVNCNTVENCYNSSKITGYEIVGGVIGYNYNGEAINCHNTGTVIGFEGGYSTGGVAGANYQGSILSCYNTGKISGIYDIGGITGSTGYGAVIDCYNDGTITGTHNIGGLVGNNIDSSVNNSYNTGKISGSQRCVGGLVGEQSNDGIMRDCYNTGEVSSNDSYTGGLIGLHSGIISDCYNAGKVTVNDNLGRVIGAILDNTSITKCYYLNTSCTGEIDDEEVDVSVEIKSSNQFESGEIAYLLQGEREYAVWGQTIGTDEYPVLNGKKVYRGYGSCGSSSMTYSNQELSTEKINHIYDDNGFCTACDTGYEPAVDSDFDGYYEIDNAGKLYWFAHQFNYMKIAANAILTADIIVNNGTISENSTDARVWTPIGHNYANFNYVFDGNGKTISGLYIKDLTSKAGLIGHAGKNSEIKNLTIENSYFNGDGYVGSIVGYIDGGKVVNCSSSVTIKGISYTGGIVGYINNGEITNCHNSGEISVSTTNSYFGGIVGNANNSKITGCYNTGVLNGGMQYIGGLIGYTSKCEVTNCYNLGTIKGSYFTGGIVGINNSSSINRCYNTGNINGSIFLGGIVSQNYGSSTITNCYNTGTISGDRYVGGIVYENPSGTVANCYNTGKILGEYYVGGIIASDTVGNTTNCYYLDTTCTGGINGKDVQDVAESKISDQFESGEITYLLQSNQEEKVWGQSLGTDTLPLLGDDEVYQVKNCKNDIIYSNTNKNIGHNEVTVKGKDATCTETGLTNGTKCSVCDEILVEQTELPAKGHTKVTIKGKDATCTETGLTNGTKCSVCNKILVAQKEIPLKEHTKVIIKGKDATCTETGLTDITKCSVCNKILVAQEIIPATGKHNYVNDYCSVCGIKEEKRIYFVPSTNWKDANARFAAYFFGGNSGEAWVSLTATTDGMYTGIMPKGYTNVVFVRMNPNTTENNWNNGTKWNQTADLTIDGNCFTLTSTAWDNGTGTWKTIDNPTEPTTQPTTNPTVENNIYFVPSTNWKEANARFSAYFFNGSSEPQWVSLTANSKGQYVGIMPTGYKSVIFVRMNPDTTNNNWDNGTKWNQTAELTINGNCFTLNAGEWDGANGTWSTVVEPTVPPTAPPTDKPTVPPTNPPTDEPTVPPTTPPTEAPTEAPTQAPTKPASYSVTGDIELKLTPCGTNKVRGTIVLQPGTYKFKLSKDGTLLGYGKTFTDSTKGLTFKSTYESYCTINASGGTYTFQVTTDKNALVVNYDSNLPEEYLVGDINTILTPVAGKPLAIGATYLEAGTYQFKISDNTVILGNGNSCTDGTAGRSVSFKDTYSKYYTLNATGGTYTFTYYTSTQKLIIGCVQNVDEANDDVHISGDIKLVLNDNNGESNIATGQATLTEGTYSFKVYNYGVAYCSGTTINNTGIKTLKSTYTKNVTLFANGGTYKFTFNKTTGELIVESV